MDVTPYLSFGGRCAEAFAFYQRALGATVLFSATFRDSPMADQAKPEWQDKIMHASLQIGESKVFGSDGMGADYHGMKGCMMSIGAKTVEEAERLFQGLSEGASITMPLAQTFWALRFGMLTDQFGVAWCVNCEAPQ